MDKLTDHIENETFYPTTDNVIYKLLTGIVKNELEYVLEPSAGSGNIAMHFMPRDQYDYLKKNIKVDCIEINPELRSVLKGKGLRVIWDDFLTFYTAKRYDLIAMNPPFNKGIEHLLHAIELCIHGGKIRCILNANTVERCLDPKSTGLLKILSIKLKELDAEIDYVDNAFKTADKKTNVRIAIIAIDIPDDQDTVRSEIFERLQKDESYKVFEDNNTDKEIVYSDFIKAVVSHYNYEIELDLRLIREFFATAPKIGGSFKPDEFGEKGSLFSLEIGGIYGNINKEKTYTLSVINDKKNSGFRSFRYHQINKYKIGDFIIFDEVQK